MKQRAATAVLERRVRTGAWQRGRPGIGCVPSNLKPSSYVSPAAGGVNRTMEIAMSGNSVLFKPFNLGPLQMQNRIVMAPMTRGQSPGNIPNE